MMRQNRTMRLFVMATGLALILTVMPQAIADSAATQPTPTTQPSGKSSADAMYQQFEAIKPPHADRSKMQNPAYRRKIIKEYKAGVKKRGELANQFYEKYPNDPRVGDILPAHWGDLLDKDKADQVLKETSAFIKKHPKSQALPNAWYFRFASLTDSSPSDVQALHQAAEAFVKAAPKDPRGGMLLDMVAEKTADKDKKVAIFKQVISDYPRSRAAQQAKSQLKMNEMVGKPFKLSFDGAISGKHYSIADMKGKIVVVDFWATWCGPCVASMPEMKKIYEKYHAKGVNFIGVSLDQSKAHGGLAKLKQFVKQHQIPWPQYYEGKGWRNSVAQKYHVRGIPCVFVIDAKGNLYSVDARGRLNTILPKLLAHKG